MDRHEYENMIREVYSVSGDRPFENYPDVLIFRHNNNKKWFAAIMTVKKSKLGMKSEELIDIVNIKCSQDIIDSMWQEDGVYPAYHMNKKHWVSIALDGSAREDTLRFLTEISYESTKTKSKRKASQS